MSLAGSYRLQNANTLEGTLNATTRWRQLPVSNTNDMLSWLRFENIAGDVIDPPDDVTVTETRPNLPSCLCLTNRTAVHDRVGKVI